MSMLKKKATKSEAKWPAQTWSIAKLTSGVNSIRRRHKWPPIKFKTWADAYKSYGDHVRYDARAA